MKLFNLEFLLVDKEFCKEYGQYLCHCFPYFGTKTHRLPEKHDYARLIVMPEPGETKDEIFEYWLKANTG